MERKQNKALVPIARNLRKNMTKEEKHLWYDFLRNYPVRFLRQKIIGKYIVDFYCPKANLAVELDGSQHFKVCNQMKDIERTAFLESYGIFVMRIPNNEVMDNFEGTCMYIDDYIKQSLRR